MLDARPRALRGNRGFLTIGAAVAVLAGSLAIALGAPEHSRLLNLLTGHGWLSSSQPGQVALANGETGQLDFRLNTGTTGDPLDVVQSGQNALLIDGKTGQAGSIDVGNLKVVNQHHLSTGSLGTAADANSMNQVLPGPDGTFYVVHRRSGRIDVSDPVSDETVATKQVGTGLSPAVVDGGDTLWTERESTGAMTGLDYQAGKLQVQQVKNSVVAPDDAVLLSAVNGTPAVLDQSRSLFFLAPKGVPGTAVSLPRTTARRPVVAPTVQGPVVPLVVGGKVVLIKGGTSSVVDLNGRAGDHLGAPVPFADRVYVPDLSDGEVIVLSDSGQQVGTPIKVASGNAALSVQVENGALFINDPDTATAYSVTTGGQVNRIDKEDPNVPTNKVTVTTPATIPNPPPVTIPTPVTPTPGKGAGSGGAGPGSTAPAAATSTVPASAPAAPGSPSAQAGDQSATVSWTPPATHGSPITGYTVKWSAGGGGSKAVGAGKTSVQVSGLKNGTSYTFSVTATNAIATGPAATTTAITPTSTVPDPPTGVTATANKDGSITVSWAKATGEGHKIAGYTVTATPTSGASLAPVAVTNGTSTSFTTAQGLVLGTSYTFTVTATNDAGGSSKPSTPSKAATSSTTPFAVTNLTASASARGTVAVSWTCNAACAGGSPLTAFSVALTPAVGGGVKVPAIGGQSQYSTNVTGLADETNYTVSVTALNKAWGAGQVANAAVLTQGQPTATVSTHWTGRSLSLSITVTPHGASVSGCHVVLTGPGGALTSSTSGGCHSLSTTAPYFAATYSGVLTITSTGFGTTNGANVGTASPPMSLDADASPAYGPAGSGKFSGPNSSSCPTRAWSTASCSNSVSGGSNVKATCWQSGTNVNNLQSGNPTQLNSTIWVNVSDMGGKFSSDPWMNGLWFNPYFTSPPSTLQNCS